MFSSESLKDKIQLLPDSDKQHLVETLAYQFNATWYDLAIELSKQFPNRISWNVITGIQQHKDDEACAKAFLKLLTTWPEITPNIFLKALYDLHLGVTANQLCQKMGITPFEVLDTENLLSERFKRLSNEEFKRFVQSLADPDTNYWKSLANELSRKCKPNKITTPFLDKLDQIHKGFDRANSFIKAVLEFPEVTPKLFLETLEALQLDTIAYKLRKKLGLLTHPKHHPNSLAKKLKILSDTDLQKLIRKLSQDDPGYWEDLAVELSKKLKSGRITTSFIDDIRRPNRKDRARIFLKKIKEWPELTPEIFLQALKDITLEVTAIELSQQLGLSPPPGLNQALVITNPGIKDKINLDDHLDGLLNNNMGLLAKIRSELGHSYNAKKQGWQVVCNKLKEIPELKLVLTDRWISGVKHSSTNSYNKTELFLNRFCNFQAATVKNFVTALGKISGYQCLCQTILNETTDPEFFKRTFKQGLQPPHFNLVELNKPIGLFLNNNVALFADVTNALKDGEMQRLVTQLSQQQYFQHEFKPTPQAWCDQLTTGSWMDTENRLRQLAGLDGLSVGVFVIALAATSADFKPLCEAICSEAKVSAFTDKLVYAHVPGREARFVSGLSF